MRAADGRNTDRSEIKETEQKENDTAGSSASGYQESGIGDAQRKETKAEKTEQIGKSGTGMDKKTAKKGRLVWRSALFVCAAALIGGAAWRITRPKEEVAQVPLPTVSIAKPERANIAVETSLIGTISAGDVYYVMPKAAGEIREIYVSQGDQVNEGDPIAKIDNQKQIDAAKIALDSAAVQIQTATDALQTAQTNLNRMQALLQTGDISAQAYEQAKSGYDQAKAALDGAKLQQKSAKLQYDTQVEYATVTSPVTGTVESENMDLNAMVTQSTQLCVITGNGAKKVTFSVTDRLLPALSAGTAVRVEKQGSAYEGSVTSVETMPNQQTGLYPVEASVADGGALTNGASVKVYFDAERADNVLAVDADSVYYDGGKVYVYTITYDDADSKTGEAQSGTKGESKPDGQNDNGQGENGAKSEEAKAGADSSASAGANASAGTNASAAISPDNRAATVHKIEVETGTTDAKRTEIKSGITADDLVIQSWTSQLYEGARVQVLPEQANADETGADETGADETGADQTDADQTDADQVSTDQANENQTSADQEIAGQNDAEEANA